jgi:hypothetical protein
VTPILVRPVREQLEHDRVIRLLQQRWRRKYVVGINQGSETAASVGQPDALIYPDVVLAPPGRPAKPEIIVEVETAESVNNLEAMAEWMRMAKLKVAFHLYVPTGSVDPAKRLCAEHRIPVAEIWTFHPIGDQMRFTMVYKAPETGRAARHHSPEPAPAARTAKPVGKAAPKAAKPGAARKSSAKPPAKRTVKPAKKSAAKGGSAAGKRG